MPSHFLPKEYKSSRLQPSLRTFLIKQAFFSVFTSRLANPSFPTSRTMTVLTMSHQSNSSKQSAKKPSSSSYQHAFDPRLVMARLYQIQRLQTEQALRTRPEPRQYVPRYVSV